MIDMRDQINETIDKFEADTGEIVKDSVKSPANHSLFLVNEGVKELDENKSDIFSFYHSQVTIHNEKSEARH